MDSIGIICEYNPFHRGHARQIAFLRERYPGAAVVCLMSGLFVQRGAPAVFSRETRAAAALLAGADLVVELPVNVSLRSAEGFADGGVALLDRLGVQGLCFGAETDRGEQLLDTARVLLLPELAQALRPYLDRGLSFPAARAKAAADLGADPGVLTRPNDILAVEYCKAIVARQSKMTPIPIVRPGDYHALEADRHNPSATALRRRIRAGEAFLDYVPEESRAAYANALPHFLAWGERAVLARLRTMPEAEFAALPHGSEGLWRRFRRACLENAGLEEILEATKSKRYTRSRIDRMAMCAFLGLCEARLLEPAPYARVLGFTARGRQALRCMPQTELVNLGKRTHDPWEAVENRCRHLFGLFAKIPELPEQHQCVIAL